MNWDHIAPHRMILNVNLRKSAQQLREETDRYKFEYEKKIQSIEAELSEVQESINNKLESVRVELNRELNNEQLKLNRFSEDFTGYINKYLHYLSIDKIISCYSAKNKVICEEMSFLSKQIDLGLKEIKILKERKKQLTNMANVNDILDLMRLNGFALCGEDDAMSLLKSIDYKLDSLEDGNRCEVYALRKLRMIVQERTEYSYAVDYISWVISNKNAYRKHLIEEFNNKRNESEEITAIISKLTEDKETFDKVISASAAAVRLYWSQPIVNLNLDIGYLKYQKKSVQAKFEEKTDERNEISDEMDYMHDAGINDQDRWESLKRKKRYLNDEIGVLYGKKKAFQKEIDEKTESRDEWFELKNYIIGICKKYKCNKKDYITRNDEPILLEKRLKELKDIKTKGLADAKDKCEKQKETLRNKYDKELGFYENQIESLTKEYVRKNTQKASLNEKLIMYRKELDYQKNNDSRGFFAKLFSDSPAVSRARFVVNNTLNEIYTIEQEISELVKRINTLKTQKGQIEQTYQKEIAGCVPVCLRPTKSELLEEKKINIRLSMINSY